MRRCLALICALWVHQLMLCPSDRAFAQTPGVSNKLSEKTAYVGVLAFRGPDATISYWQPLIRYLSDTIPGWKFKLLPVTLVSAVAQIENKRIDFMITNPGHYVTLAERFSLSALSTRERLREGTERNLLEYGSAIFVRKQSKINALSELKGLTIAAVSPNAFGGFQIAWNEMKAQGIDVFSDLASIRYMGFPQDSIVNAVSNGEVDAGIVRSGLIESMADEGRLALGTLRVLNSNTQLNYPYQISSHLYPEWPFSAVPGIEKKLREDVLQALLNTQNAEIVSRFKLLDIWSAPLSYENVRLLVKSYESRGGSEISFGGRALFLYTLYAVLAAIAVAGLSIAVGVLWQKKMRGNEGKVEKQGPQDAKLIEVQNKFEMLTPREREILVMICNGYQNKSIAEELLISPKTVEFHRTNLLHKTEAGTTAHLVQLATRLGFDQGVSLG